MTADSIGEILSPERSLSESTKSMCTSNSVRPCNLTTAPTTAFVTSKEGSTFRPTHPLSS